MSMTRSELHVVLGATGNIGRSLVDELAGGGVRVRAVSRSLGAGFPVGVETLAADARVPEDAKRACAGAAVVYHCINGGYESWARELMPLTEAVIAGAEAARARLVVADNLYMYPETDRPLTEDLPWTPATRKGRLRAQSSQMLMDAHRAGRVRVSIARMSDFYGPYAFNAAAGPRVFEAVLRSKPIGWLGRTDVLHTFHYLPDSARGMAILAGRDAAFGEVWHLPATEPISGQGFAKLLGELLRRPVRIQSATRLMVRIAGVFIPMMRELVEMMPQWERPFVSDHSKFVRAFGPFEVTPHREAFRVTLEWFAKRAGLAVPPALV